MVTKTPAPMIIVTLRAVAWSRPKWRCRPGELDGGGSFKRCHLSRRDSLNNGVSLIVTGGSDLSTGGQRFSREPRASATVIVRMTSALARGSRLNHQVFEILGGFDSARLSVRRGACTDNGGCLPGAIPGVRFWGTG